MHKIFVSIASYRDPELKKTLESLISNAKNPENLRIAIAWQHSKEDEWDDLSEYDSDPRFDIIDIDHVTSKGVCWARNLIQQRYNGEEYYLQLDSHHRFEKNWDRTLLDWLHYLQCVGHKKPILSAYLPGYFPKEDPVGRVNEVWGLNIDRFLPEGAVFLRPHHVDNWQTLESPFKSRFMSAHFIFTIGKFVEEVPYDPNFYFHGEETSLSARSFTHGYDLFSPHRPIIWHEYTREGKKKHWDDSSEWSNLDRESYKRFRILFGMEPGCSSCQRNSVIRQYAFGNIRSLQDYEKYAGLKFETRQIHRQTKENKFPPITDDYESGLCYFQKYCIDLYKGSVPEKDYDGFAVALLRENGEDIFRQDLTEQEIEALFNQDPNDQFLHIWRDYESNEKPKSWRVWPHSKSKGWCDKIEQDIRYE